eukprot:CAMPEP_0170867378 /NCGR_PEP_ID=MMETSP0734-20130129/22748_1 /TAXON_ID=186038 /ORGANISM="Fragilariopsis kerguelensis, Strain L26-C5" /LENGTH=291 /DNA_ID=CAMNT_0011244587 /DNA_START=132 /DNA_END=1007 /DNA_ORIENTATION=-
MKRNFTFVIILMSLLYMSLQYYILASSRFDWLGRDVLVRDHLMVTKVKPKVLMASISDESSVTNNNNKKKSHENEMVIGYIPTGKWIYQPNRTFVAPICCGWDESAYKKHPECGKLPMPKQEYWGGYTFVGLKNSLAHMGGHGCSCNLFKDEYVLDNLPMWNPVQTCEKLGSRRVLMIGDSTMVQMAATLMNAVRPGGCQTQFTFMVGDTLTNKRMGSLNRGTLWTTSVILKKPDIVILSAGPHVYKRKKKFRACDGFSHPRYQKPNTNVSQHYSSMEDAATWRLHQQDKN